VNFEGGSNRLNVGKVNFFFDLKIISGEESVENYTVGFVDLDHRLTKVCRRWR
jgi:hypothetical protein